MYVCVYVTLQSVRAHARLLRLLRTHLHLLHNARPQRFRLSGELVCDSWFAPGRALFAVLNRLLRTDLVKRHQLWGPIFETS